MNDLQQIDDNGLDDEDMSFDAEGNAYDAIVIIQIDDPADHIAPDKRIELSRRMVRLLGADNFTVGRTSPTCQQMRMAFEEVEPITREVAHEIDMPSLEGKAYWVGNYRMHNPRSKTAQCIQIKLRNIQYAGRETPTQDWPFLAMLYDWVKANGIKGKIILGVDAPEFPFIEITDDLRDVIHGEYLRSDPTDIIRDLAGEIVGQNVNSRMDYEHPDHYHCAACDDVMAYKGDHERVEELYDEETGEYSTKSTPTGGERHECRSCGERSVVYKDEFDRPFAHWMGASGLRRMSGEIRVAVFEPSVRGVDLSLQTVTTEGDFQLITDWSAGLSRALRAGDVQH
jgi:hypothetical protein